MSGDCTQNIVNQEGCKQFTVLSAKHTVCVCVSCMTIYLKPAFTLVKQNHKKHQHLGYIFKGKDKIGYIKKLPFI